MQKQQQQAAFKQMRAEGVFNDEEQRRNERKKSQQQQVCGMCEWAVYVWGRWTHNMLSEQCGQEFTPRVYKHVQYPRLYGQQ